MINLSCTKIAGSYTENGSPKYKNDVTSMFMGRYEGYPKELNILFKYFRCELCDVSLNSLKTANIHYESKSHDKNITAWLIRNYTDLGLEPPQLERFYSDGSVGPNAFYCASCNLKLTSKSHAYQHFSGRRHKSVATNQFKLIGQDCYEGEKFCKTSISTDNKVLIKESMIDFSNSNQLNINRDKDQYTEIKNIVQSKSILKNSIYCSLCNTSINSTLQMSLHLKGIKHHMKLKSNSHQKIQGKSNVNSLHFDKIPYELSLYRTPSGSFYCKICNMSMDHQTALLQHLLGKKHIKMSVNKPSNLTKYCYSN